MSTAALSFKRAARHAVKLKIGIDGPSGSGKTEGALAIAAGICPGGRIAVADSENESASYYSDRYTFDTVPLPEDATPKMMTNIIDLAVNEGYDVLVIDSLSRIWLNILSAKDVYDLANPSANRWTSWGLARFGPAWEELMKHLLGAPIHVIATMRSKQAHEQVENDKGKKQVVKLGLQPQVREGAEYEFGLVFSVNMAHRALATKDRTHLFEADEMIDLCGKPLHKRLVQWMNTGGEAPTAPARPQLHKEEGSQQPSPRQSAPALRSNNGASSQSAAPNCPICNAAMADDSLTKTNVRAPDYRCETPGCDGKYWPGQWPPKPIATDAQRAQIATLLAAPGLDAKLVKKVQKALDNTEKPMKQYRADEVIAELTKLAAAAPVPAAVAAASGGDHNTIGGEGLGF